MLLKCLLSSHCNVQKYNNFNDSSNYEAKVITKDVSKHNRDIRSCKNCHCLSNEDFKQVVNLKNSGLVIYIHYNKSKQKKNYGDYSGNNIILHNTSNRDIKRFDYIVELCQYRTKCLKCKMLIQRVRNAIDDISSINKNDVIGVCDFCKRSHQKNKCKRCEYIVEKFVTNKAIQDEKRDVRFKLWLSKLQQILISVLEAKVICKHNICLDFEYKSQLYKLLNSLNSPVPMRQPEIDEFPELFNLKESGFDIGESREFLEGLVTQLKYDANGENNDVELSFNSSGSESGCICKHFVNSKRDNKLGVNNKYGTNDIAGTNNKPGTSVEILSQDQEYLRKMSLTKGDENESTFMTFSENQNQNKLKTETSMDQKLKLTEASKKTQNRNLRSNKENELPKNISSSKVKKGAGINGTEKKDTSKKSTEKMGAEKGKKGKQSSEYRLMMEMLAKREKEKKALEQLEKNKTKQVLPTIKDLPELKPRKRRVIEENIETQKSESILECKNNQLDVVTEMIKGTEVVKFDSHYRDIDDTFQKLPQLFNIRIDVTAPTMNKQTVSLKIPESHSKNKKHEKEESVTNSGIIRYELSNREFIEKGWTKLPTTKVMRRMNIYKMMPSSDKFDWFKRYKKQTLLFYQTGEKFAEINDTGGGKWFYKNGNVALDGYCSQESGTMKRYIIYSSGEELVSGKKEPITILGCFDKYGNGVVYDCYGNVRLKYNQSEGVLMDKNIAAPGRWKWHTLNDPPILQHVFHNTYDHSQKHESFTDIHLSDNIAQANQEMIAIELDNFVKEKANKLMQKFKPFQIRIKVLKINNYFSLRIIDQANIFLLFRCDGICFKIDLGMLLKSDEIIDTDVAEVSDVSTPFDKVPPRSRSLINIQKSLNDVRKYYGSCKKNK